MTGSRDHLEMAYRSISCFGSDGLLNVGELRQIVAIAERDGVVDDNERRVLRMIFSRLTPAELDTTMLADIEALRARHNF
jgi:hypothetical protein